VIFNGSEDLVNYMHQLPGHSITGLNTEHVLPILWGRGRNGKGILLEVLRHVLGPLAGLPFIECKETAISEPAEERPEHDEKYQGSIHYSFFIKFVLI